MAPPGRGSPTTVFAFFVYVIVHDFPSRGPAKVQSNLVPKKTGNASHHHASNGTSSNVLHLTSYDPLEAYLGIFAQGHFNLLILVGSGGLAKCRSVRAAARTARRAGSRATPRRSACTPSSIATDEEMLRGHQTLVFVAI